MGTEVQLKSFFPRYYSSRVVNEDSNGCNWPLYYTDQTSPNGHLSNSFQWVTAAAAATDASIDYDKFALKKKMLEHESVFKKQVHELHRLYRIQKDLMDEVKRKELSPYHAIVASNTPQASPFNGFSRPSKIGKEKLSLHLPAVVYIDLEESGENEVKDGFDLNQPAQMDDTASSDFVHPRSISFFESMVGAHQGSSHRGTNGYPGFKEKLCISSQQNLHNKIHEVPHLFNGHQFRIDHTRLLPTCGAESSKHWDSGVASHASKHQIAASYDREESSSQLFENQSIHRSSAEKCEQPESSIFGKSLKNAVIDINLPCDDLVTEESPSTKRSTLKCDFDLNSCMDEDDTYCLAVDGRNMGVKIDLESPAFEDTEGSVHLEETAAEAIVAMSSLTAVEAEEVLSPDNLNWFVNIALRDQTKKMDYFESMTLKLTEMDEEEHLPKAFEVEDDEVGCAPTNTDRAHHRRRGRQKRRDFQRDILPGLTSLSSQEVAEDLLAFGGLMRATGHVWGPFGSSSRKGSCRGRRRTIARPVAVVPTVTDNALDTLRLEEGSLMGWGKTRRARQQRCPAGNFRSSINGSSSLLDYGSGCL